MNRKLSLILGLISSMTFTMGGAAFGKDHDKSSANSNSHNLVPRTATLQPEENFLRLVDNPDLRQNAVYRRKMIILGDTAYVISDNLDIHKRPAMAMIKLTPEETEKFSHLTDREMQQKDKFKKEFWDGWSKMQESRSGSKNGEAISIESNVARSGQASVNQGGPANRSMDTASTRDLGSGRTSVQSK